MIRNLLPAQSPNHNSDYKGRWQTSQKLGSFFFTSNENSSRVKTNKQRKRPLLTTPRRENSIHMVASEKDSHRQRRPRGRSKMSWLEQVDKSCEELLMMGTELRIHCGMEDPRVWRWRVDEATPPTPPQPTHTGLFSL